jgi:hypothetical protein
MNEALFGEEGGVARGMVVPTSKVLLCIAADVSKMEKTNAALRTSLATANRCVLEQKSAHDQSYAKLNNKYLLLKSEVERLRQSARDSKHKCNGQCAATRGVSEKKEIAASKAAAAQAAREEEARVRQVQLENAKCVQAGIRLIEKATMRMKDDASGTPPEMVFKDAMASAVRADAYLEPLAKAVSGLLSASMDAADMQREGGASKKRKF